MQTYFLLFLSSLVLFVSNWPARAAGPAENYYVTIPDHQQLVAVKGSNVVFNVTTPTLGETPLAVGSTIRTFGVGAGASGTEYALDGTVLGGTYTNTVGGSNFYDGATDGTFNYSVDYFSNTVYRFSLDWTSPIALFTVSDPNGYAGITFDSADDSLWVASFDGTTIGHYSMSGDLLSSFNVSHAGSAALAYNSTDGTLWLANNTNRGTFEQYSLSGDLLSSVHYAALESTSANILGGEFVSVPEPSTWALFAIGLSAAAYGIKTRRQA